jgi:hypothetical protein
MYACAMPATQHAVLDPNSGSLECASDGSCDPGYACSAENRCVVPLDGGKGLGINKDGTTWWESGQCDESCQRWVSACLLARTNAYGVVVHISLRAPATAPPGQELQFEKIQTALQTTEEEVRDYNLREGAYYGNIFARTPVNPPPSPDYTGPAVGPIQNTPSFNACAGPASNVPEITKRFNSSQGDQVVINVPGVCEATGVCDGVDDECTGAVHGCNATGIHYDEVLTVYLAQPTAVCGNDICEERPVPLPPGCAAPNAPPPIVAEDATSCPEDCHGWAKDYSPNLGMAVIDTTPASNDANSQDGNMAAMSDVAPDDTIVVAGLGADINLGGAPISNVGNGVLAKYTPEGTLLWWTRVLPPGNLSGDYNLNGVRVGRSGNIVVVGYAVESFVEPCFDSTCPAADENANWINVYDPNGNLLSGYVPIHGASTVPTDPTRHTFTVPFVRAFAVGVRDDSVILTGTYKGTTYFGTAATCQASNLTGGGFFVAKVSPGGEMEWNQCPTVSKPALTGNLPGGQTTPPVARSVVVDTEDNIVLLTSQDGSDALQQVLPDGTSGWLNNGVNDPAFGSDTVHTVATVSLSSRNIYTSGYSISSKTLDCPQDSLNPGSITIYGHPPFVAKYSGAGVYIGTKSAEIQWPPDSTLCNTPNLGSTSTNKRVEGVSIGFDRRGFQIGGADYPDGKVLVGYFGNPFVGGGIDFGTGLFPTYGSNNLFVAEYSADLSRVLWAKQTPTILSGSMLGMGFDSAGHVVTSGNYSGSMLINDHMLVTPAPQSTTVLDSYLSSSLAPSLSDATPPVVGAARDQSGATISTMPGKIFVQATSKDGTDVFFMPPTALDSGDGGIYAGSSVTCSPPPNTVFPVGTTTVTCTASDPVGNHSSKSFTVTVADLLGPEISDVPGAITAEATGPDGAIVTYPLPTAFDQVDGSRPVTCDKQSGSTFAVGMTTVTCTSADTRGNTASASFTVTVVDTKGPTLTIPSDITAEATSPAGAAVPFAPSANDTVEGARPVTCQPRSGSTFPLGPTIVQCTAADTHGNTASASFTVTVVDTTPPTLSLPGSITATASSTNGAVVNYSASATDLVDGAISPVCSRRSGSTFALGTTVVNCTASDSHGNTATGSFQIAVQYAGFAFLPPVRADGSSIFNLGSTVPVKFRLSNGSASVTNAVATLSVAKISSGIVGTHMEATSTSAATTGNAFRYDSASGDYIFNLRTQPLSKGTWQLSVDLKDGVSRTVTISLR